MRDRRTRTDKTVSVMVLVQIRAELIRRMRQQTRHSDVRLELRGAIRGLGMAIASAVHTWQPKGPRQRRTLPATDGKPHGTDKRRRMSL